MQSGILIFDAGRRTASALEKTLEAETSTRLNLSVDYLFRTAHEFRRIVERNPFPDEAEHEPSRVIVMVLKDKPNARTFARWKLR